MGLNDLLYFINRVNFMKQYVLIMLSCMLLLYICINIYCLDKWIIAYFFFTITYCYCNNIIKRFSMLEYNLYYSFYYLLGSSRCKSFWGPSTSPYYYKIPLVLLHLSHLKRKKQWIFHIVWIIYIWTEIVEIGL